LYRHLYEADSQVDLE